MKIVEGPTNGKWTMRIICRIKTCCAVLEIEEEDLHFRNSAVAYAGETWDPSLYVTCPCCSSRTFVTWDVPSGIRSKIFDANR